MFQDHVIKNIYAALSTACLLIGAFASLEYSGLLKLGNSYFCLDAFNILAAVVFLACSVIIQVADRRRAGVVIQAVPAAIMLAISAINAYTCYFGPSAPFSDKDQIMALALLLICAALFAGALKKHKSEADELRSLID